MHSHSTFFLFVKKKKTNLKIFLKNGITLNGESKSTLMYYYRKECNVCGLALAALCSWQNGMCDLLG